MKLKALNPHSSPSLFGVFVFFSLYVNWKGPIQFTQKFGLTEYEFAPSMVFSGLLPHIHAFLRQFFSPHLLRVSF